ncbi:MAG: translocation/assembly module TamB domain-containing protein, partial [Bacteroides sp.]|nr:translocation/assembly module TamB domain-containing protein [Bacteroides sp.]
LRVPLLAFNFEAFSAFKHFSYEVDLGFITDNSRLRLEDLAYFAPLIPTELLDELIVNGEVSGKLSDMKGDDLTITFDDRSSLACDFMMIGLPDFKNTFTNFNFKRLNSNVRAISMITGSRSDSIAVPYPWGNLGNLAFAGSFTGYPDDFVASGLLGTDMGRIEMDLSFKPDSIRGVDFQGRLRTKDFQLGSFFSQEEKLDQLDMDVFTNGSLYDGQIRASLEGTIDTLDIFSYAYSNITLDGEFTNSTFEGGFSVSDPNIKMDFQGRTDFSGEVPVHRFTADVARARPFFLNLPQSDPNYFISFLINTDLSGGSIDELNGEIKLVNSLFEKTDAQVQVYDLTLTTRNTPAASLIRLRSEMMDVDVTGQYKLSSLPESFRNLADHFMNIDRDAVPFTDTSNYFVFSADVKRINPFLKFFYPTLQMGNYSQLSGIYDPSNTDIQMEGSFPSLTFGKNSWYQVNGNLEKVDGRLTSLIESDSTLINGGFALYNQDFELTAGYDTATLDVRWESNDGPEFSGDISLLGTFMPDSSSGQGFFLEMNPSLFVLNDTTWKVEAANMLVKKDYLKLSNFEVNSLGKKIQANGVISSDESQDFNLELENLKLGQLTRLMNVNMDLQGEITGNIHFMRADSIPILISNLELDSLVFNQHLLGTTLLDANWDDSENALKIGLTSERSGQRVLEVSGDFIPGSEALDFNIRLSDFDIASLNPYTGEVAGELSGEASVNLTLDGTLKRPQLNGSISFSESSANISYLNTRYITNDQVRIYRNNFYFEDFKAEDIFGNGANVNGSVSNLNLKDFYLNLNIDATNIQCMNTSAMDNEVFYGNFFGTGNVGISGPPNNISLKISATTEKNTALFLPLYNASEVVSSDFLTFVSAKEEKEAPLVEELPAVSGVEMELEIDVTNDAVVQLLFDPNVGDIIQTSGTGNIRIMLDKEKGFRMFGDVVLQEGEYLFTLQNVINKRFKIEPGGIISFNGSPTSSSVDMKAIYTTRAAPYNLYPDNDDKKEALKKRIPVECHLNLLGELQAPTLDMGIIMPTADAETRNLLENSTSTEEELMKQFLSLLVINNFYSVTGLGTQDLGTPTSIAGVTASELLSNQLSNWLSQISDDFDIGINYRPGDQVTSDEVEVALSTQLLNDRIIISGNVDVGGQETNPSVGDPSNPYIVGDFDVEFRITDNVSVFAFNRARDELLFDTDPYKQGVGISYREEFNNLNQLFNRYKEGIANRKKKRKKKKNPELDE